MSIRNSCKFTGRIVYMKMIEQENNKILKFSLAIKRIKGSKKQKEDILDFEAWNNIAELINNNSNLGKMIEVCGEARKDKYSYKGENRYRQYYTVDEIDIREWNEYSKEIEEVKDNEIEEIIMGGTFENEE